MTVAPSGRPISEFDLLAYVDGQLDRRRREEVEMWLLHRPADAFRIAADLAIMRGLREIFGKG